MTCSRSISTPSRCGSLRNSGDTLLDSPFGVAGGIRWRHGANRPGGGARDSASHHPTGESAAFPAGGLRAGQGALPPCTGREPIGVYGVPGIASANCLDHVARAQELDGGVRPLSLPRPLSHTWLVGHHWSSVFKSRNPCLTELTIACFPASPQVVTSSS